MKSKLYFGLISKYFEQDAAHSALVLAHAETTTDAPQEARPTLI
ncbi:MAG TPA: hypothetical protein VNM47_10970 [Terriglobia bacterium]|nr:hypothetical protein [Terriglobia bacterium]